MTGQQLKNSILQEAIQGRLVPNVLQPGEKTGAELLQDILAERQKKAPKLTLSTIEEEPWELPEGWCWCRLDDLCRAVGNKYNQIKSSDIKPQGIFPVVSQGQAIVDGYFDDSTKVINDIPVIIFGDHTKNVKYIDFPFIIGADGTKVLSPFPNVYAKWFYYVVLYFSSIVLYDRGYARHFSLLNKESFPFPPISIQKAIVAKIEELFPLVDEYDKAAGELKVLNESLPDKLRKSVLQEAIHGTLVPNDIPDGEATAQELLQQILKERQDKENKEKGKKAKKLTLSEIEEEPWELPEGWCWCSIEDICSKIVDGDHNPPIGQIGTTDYLMLSSKNINNDSLVDLDSVRYLSKTDFDKADTRTNAKCGDILLTTVATLGRSCIFDGSIKAVFQRSVTVITTLIYNCYLKIYLDSPLCQGIINDKATGTAQRGFYLNQFSNLLVPLPPLSIQHRIVEKIEQLFSEIEKL